MLSSALNNSGLVESQSGTLALQGGDTSTGSTYQASSGATVSFTSGTVNLTNATFSGGGTVQFAGATATVNGTTAVAAAVSVTSGTLTFSTGATVSLPSLALSGGTIQGNDSLALTGIGSTWSGGTIQGTGALTINTGAALTVIFSDELVEAAAAQ